MICPACKSALADELRFCLHCGHYLGEPDEVTRVIPSGSAPKTNVNVAVPRFESIEKGREPWALGSGVLVVGGVVIFILGVVIALAFISQRSESTQTRNANGSLGLATASPTRRSTPAPVPTQSKFAATPQPSLEQSTPLPVRETIVDSTFPVRARSYETYSFNVTGAGHLMGNFSATGGRDDIDVWVIDANEMPNFANSHRTYFYYHSDYVSYGEINLRLKPGSYYIVFSNRTALLTNKIVEAHVFLNQS